MQVNRAQAHFVFPELLPQFRSRRDEALLQEVLALHAAAAIDEGAGSAAQLVVAPFPSEQGSQRVTAAAPLDKAKNQSASSLRRLRHRVVPRAPR